MIRKRAWCEACIVIDKLKAEHQLVFVINDDKGILLCPYHTAIYDANRYWRLHALGEQSKVYRRVVDAWVPG